MLKEQQFYCVKCRDKESLSAGDICFRMTKNHKPQLTGWCNHCGTRLFKFVKEDDKEYYKKHYKRCYRI